MGHLLSAKSSLVPLIDRLNRYPVGLVDSEKLRTILGLLFTDEEAYVASRFPLHEATVEELGEFPRLGAPALQDVLESMADKGLVMDMAYGGKTYYLLVPGLVGVMEFTFMCRSPKLTAPVPLADLAQLMSDYLHENARSGQAAEFFGSPTQLPRALVHPEHIPLASSVTAYEDARRIIEQADYCTVTLCCCRHKKQHMGKPCREGAPVDSLCMVLGEGARQGGDAGGPGTGAIPWPDARHRQRAGEAVFHLQLLSLLLRVDGRGSGRLCRRHRQDALNRPGGPPALQLLRRLPGNLQRQMHRARQRRPGSAEKSALRRGGSGNVSGVRRVHRRLLKRGHSPTRAPPPQDAAERPRTNVLSNPLGKRPVEPFPDGAHQTSVAEGGQSDCQPVIPRNQPRRRVPITEGATRQAICWGSLARTSVAAPNRWLAQP